MKLNQYDVATGAFVKNLFVEKHARYVEPEEPMQFVPMHADWFVWESERSGYNHLYLYDMNGKQLKQLTSGNNTVTKNLGWDAEGKNLLVQIATNNGLDRAIYQVSSAGKMKLITTNSGTYNAIPHTSGLHFLTTFTNLSTPNDVSLYSAGKVLRDLYKAPNPVAKYNLPSVEFVKLQATDSTVLNGRIIKPAKMVAGKKYPALVYLYGGPHAQMVTNTWQGGANNWMEYMATKGYVVFTMDNRGSSGRGQKFEDVVHNHLGTIQMEDQMKGVEYLKTLPFVDASRMGIHGWSFGGFMTTTMMTRQPDVFKAGVAGGPVIDWALYEIMYTERYMDTPKSNKEGYDESNVLKYVPNLKGRLMLIHGTIDDVVVWQHSQLFVQECVKKGKLVDYMIYPAHKHNVMGKDRLHLMRAITQYFEDHL
jgi:dipeptidyl-peptidase-4